MQAQKRAGTAVEMVLRRRLHASGCRYRVQYPVPGMPRRSIDIAFVRVKLAVFVDGCFWHGCPIHGTRSKTNADFWREKIAANRERDAETSAHLTEQGWLVVRIWEHEDLSAAAEKIRVLLELTAPRMESH
ncbi:DNA mismatch endonuclease Vsr [Pseudactinotalea sp. HY160]|nr:DNA mismatch endonuclease Vsr [Pseudactinotalea sp. HY160]